MIKTINMLREELKEYCNPDAKVKRLVDEGALIPIIRGLYETDRSVPGYYLASSIYGPSYLSFEFALSYHGLIPEAVYHFTCATFEKKKQKKYTTRFGIFLYRDVPGSAYPADVFFAVENGYSYQIASAEKAICDMLYKTSPRSNLSELRAFLFDDMRIEPDDFFGLDLDKLRKLCSLYRTKNHRLMESLVRKGK